MLIYVYFCFWLCWCGLMAVQLSENMWTCQELVIGAFASVCVCVLLSVLRGRVCAVGFTLITEECWGFVSVHSRWYHTSLGEALPLPVCILHPYLTLACTSVNAKDKYGRLPLEIARSRDHRDAVAALFDHQHSSKKRINHSESSIF